MKPEPKFKKGDIVNYYIHGDFVTGMINEMRGWSRVEHCYDYDIILFDHAVFEKDYVHETRLMAIIQIGEYVERMILI